MFLDRVEEIHLTRVHTSNSGNVVFPNVNWKDWNQETIEKTIKDEKNDFSTTYSRWSKNNEN